MRHWLSPERLAAHPEVVASALLAFPTAAADVNEVMCIMFDHGHAAADGTV
jgi:hypothetical protein